jgi:membrane-associated phospholipid phosphatase
MKELHGSGRDDGLALRLAGVAAAFAAGWLAGRVANRGAIASEGMLAVDPDSLPKTLKGASHGLSILAYPLVYLPLSLGIASVMRRRGVESADAVPRSALAAWLTYHVVKSLVDRERPPSEQGKTNDDRSYPSGHATAAAAIATSSAFLLLRGDRAGQGSVMPAALGIPVLVGASRVALGKHWPTDILGGWATGVAVASHVTANRTALR